MSKRYVSSRALAFVGLALGFASSFASAQVVPGAPFETAKVVGPIPALPVATGPLPWAPINKTSPDDVHEGVFTWGLDLLTPSVSCTTPTSCTAPWLDQIYPTPAAAFMFTASPNFIGRLKDEALFSAQQHLSLLDAGAIGSAFQKFDALPGPSVTVPTSSKERFVGYQPVRARWLKSRWAPNGKVWWMVEDKVNYADYFPFEDLRLQGARLYCAARTMQFVQGGDARSLGERVGFSISVLGQTIDFLVVEGTVALDGPSKFLAPVTAGVTPDGAQAFSIPFKFGTRVTPIRGIGLPALDEARTPLVLVTGDTEVVTGANKRLIFELGKGGLVSKNVFSKEYHTVTHADAILSAGFYGDKKFFAHKDVPVFLIGPLLVKATFELDYEVGKPSPHDDDRILQAAPWPNLPRVGHRYQNPGGLAYHDGAWLLAWNRPARLFEWQVQPEGTTNPFWRDPIATLSPTDLRALTNDDHTLRSSTGLGLSLGLDAELGVSAGPFEVSANVKGSVTGSVAQHHVVRDALMAQDPPPGFLTRMVPSTVVTVRPQQTAAVTFDGMTAGLKFSLDLDPFGSINFQKVFFSVPKATLADYDSDDDLGPSDERYMLRLASGSALGSVMTKPSVYSHLPGGGDFLSFPTDVSACLADETPAPELKAPCPPPPDNGAPPTINVCMYGPSLSLIEKLGSLTSLSLPPLPPNACTNSGGWPNMPMLSPEVKACFAAFLSLLCQPTATQLNWQGVEVVSHVWNLDGEYGWAIKNVIKQCQTAFDGPDSPLSPLFEDLIPELISVGPCKDDGTLVPGDSVIEAVNPTKAPAPKPGATCAQ